MLESHVNLRRSFEQNGEISLFGQSICKLSCHEPIASMRMRGNISVERLIFHEWLICVASSSDDYFNGEQFLLRSLHFVWIVGCRKRQLGNSAREHFLFMKEAPKMSLYSRHACLLHAVRRRRFTVNGSRKQMTNRFHRLLFNSHSNQIHFISQQNWYVDFESRLAVSMEAFQCLADLLKEFRNPRVWMKTTRGIYSSTVLL